MPLVTVFTSNVPPELIDPLASRQTQAGWPDMVWIEATRHDHSLDRDMPAMEGGPNGLLDATTVTMGVVQGF